jgi:Tol biopolymer transport system component
VVRSDGTGLRKLADRGDYSGSFEPLKHPDFHSAGSDLPVWSPDSQWVYFTAQVGPAVELMRVSMAGKVEQLTRSPAGMEHYYPEVSPDGRLVAFGVRQNGASALCVADADGHNARLITAPTPDHVPMYPKWQPLPR